MDVNIIFKIAGIGIVVTVINQILSKNGRDDYGDNGDHCGGDHRFTGRCRHDQRFFHNR